MSITETVTQTVASGFERATAAMFKSKAAENVDAVRAKLSAATEQLAYLNTLTPAKALAAALDEPGAQEDQTAHLGAIEATTRSIGLLRAALQEAERREQERLAELDAEAAAQAKKVIAQHVANLRRHGAEYERLCEQQARCWDEMVNASKKLLKLLGSASATQANSLHPSRLTRLCEQELLRVAYRKHPTQVPWPLPGSKRPMVYRPES